MKTVDSVSINFRDVKTFDFQMLQDIVYTISHLEFSSDETIKTIFVHLDDSTYSLTVNLNNQWGGVTTKTVSRISVRNADVDEVIHFMYKEYEKWFKLSMEDKMKLSYIKMSDFIRNGKLISTKV